MDQSATPSLAEPAPPIARTVAVLALTQLIGWGTVGLLTIVGDAIAADLALPLSLIFAGPSVLYVIMGVAAPFLVAPFARFGISRVMAAGSLLASAGFTMLAGAQGAVLYFGAWLVLGLAGAATLTTAAHIFLNSVAGAKSKSAITALMLLTGLSSTVFLPLTGVIEAAMGWRVLCLVFAALLVGLNFPLYVFVLRAPAAPANETPTPASTASPPRMSRVFVLLVSAISLNAFVTFGLAAILVTLLGRMGLDSAQAIVLASTLGITQVGARALEMTVGRRWDGLTTALAATLLLPMAMVILLAGGTNMVAVTAFFLIYGIGSGALAVARSTLPLVFYDKQDYALAMSRLALPLNLLLSIAPPVLAGTLDRAGWGSVLALLIVCTLGSLACLVLLRRHRPRTVPA